MTRMMGRPYPVAQRLLGVLKAHPGQTLTTGEIVAEAGYDLVDRSKASGYLSTYAQRGSGEWSSVHKVGHGRYVYDPDGTVVPPAPPGWVEVARDDDVVVLRSPENRLYRATPLAAERTVQE